MRKKANEERTIRTRYRLYLSCTHMPIHPDIENAVLASHYGEAGFRVAEKLTENSHEAWWVGGGVRDMLMDSQPVDIDITTSATPQEVGEIFAKHEDTGGQFGSIVIREKGFDFEITTFREDDEASNGRHPESVTFTKNREKDAARRDLTINAIYWNPLSRELFDPYAGENDLKEKLIRFIGDPQIRIRHDALRMLRAVRLRAAISGQYHPDTYHALQELASTITVLSGSRQLQELEKMLLGPKAHRALEDLWETGILKYMLPELYACKGIPQPADYHHEGDVWDHTLQCVAFYTDEQGIDVRIAALFHDCGKAETFSLKERIRFDHHATVSADLAAKALNRLQMTKKRIDKISWIIKHHMMMGTFFEMNDERKAHWYFHPWFPELLQVFWLDVAGTEPADFQLYDKILKDYNYFLDTHPRPPKILLTGQEVMDILQLQPGEKVGQILKSLHDAQIRKEITTKKEAKELLHRLNI